MNNIKFTSIPTNVAEHYWNGGLDDYQQKPKIGISDGSGLPCRHCQEDIAEGDEYLLFAYRPFDQQNHFSETGPIFLHKERCHRHPETEEIPEIFLKRDFYQIKGYNSDHSIHYNTGKIIKPSEIISYAKDIFEREDIEYLHLRSAAYGCFSCRIDRA